MHDACVLLCAMRRRRRRLSPTSAGGWAGGRALLHPRRSLGSALRLSFRRCCTGAASVLPSVHCVRLVLITAVHSPGSAKIHEHQAHHLPLSGHHRCDAEAAVRYLNGTVLDDRAIRVDHDWGFVEGRQWGRGRSGGQVRLWAAGRNCGGAVLAPCALLPQRSSSCWMRSAPLQTPRNRHLSLPPQVRDEFRLDYDPGRGGFGKVVQKEILSQQMKIAGEGGQGSHASSHNHTHLEAYSLRVRPQSMLKPSAPAPISNTPSSAVVPTPRWARRKPSGAGPGATRQQAAADGRLRRGRWWRRGWWWWRWWSRVSRQEPSGGQPKVQGPWERQGLGR